MRRFVTFIAIITSILAFPAGVFAISISPSSGNIQPGYNQTINVVASSVPANSTVMQLNLGITGPCQISNYTAPSGGTWGLSIPSCSGGVAFTSSQVCIALSKSSSTIQNGESLGTMVVNCSAEGSLTVSSTSGAGYVSDGNLSERVGTLGTFSVSGSIPNTALSLTDFTTLGGIGLVIFGVVLFYSARAAKKNEF